MKFWDLAGAAVAVFSCFQAPTETGYGNPQGRFLWTESSVLSHVRRLTALSGGWIQPSGLHVAWRSQGP